MSEWADSIVGKFYLASLDGKIHRVMSYDYTVGFWIEEVGNPDNRRCVSERAIDKTLHERVYDPDGNRWVTRAVAYSRGLLS